MNGGAYEHFVREMGTLETRGSGRITAALLDPVRVDVGEGTRKKVGEVASVGVKEGNVLVVTVFDENVSCAFWFSEWSVDVEVWRNVNLQQTYFDVGLEECRESYIRSEDPGCRASSGELYYHQNTHSKVSIDVPCAQIGAP